MGVRVGSLPGLSYLGSRCCQTFPEFSLGNFDLTLLLFWGFEYFVLLDFKHVSYREPSISTSYPMICMQFASLLTSENLCNGSFNSHYVSTISNMVNS